MKPNKSNNQASIKVTSKTLDKLDTLSVTQNNLTTTYRSILDYYWLLGFTQSWADLIKNRFVQTNEKVTILDAGCGEGVAMGDLLADKDLTPILGKCVGASLHFFPRIADIFGEHGNRFEYFCGPVQSTLKQTHEKFDFITDVAGAFLYSDDVLNLLRQYYQALKPGGKAFIFDSQQDPNLIKSPIHGRFVNLRNFLCKQYPDIFSQTKGTHLKNGILSTFPVIIMNKTSMRFPLHQSFKVKSFNYASTIGGQLPLYQLKKGNAVAPVNTKFVPDEAPRMQLRTLRYTKT